MWITPHRPDLLNSISKCYWTPTMTSSPKGNQPWIFTGRTDAEAEAPIFWPPDGTSWLIGKDPDPGKDWRQKEKRAAEDEMVGWHHRLNGHEFKSKLQKIVEDRGTWHTAVHGVAKSQTSLSDWTMTTTNMTSANYTFMCVCVLCTISVCMLCTITVPLEYKANSGRNRPDLRTLSCCHC